MPHAEGPERDYDPAFIRLVQTALAKKRSGQKLKREEQRAIERYQRDEEERARKRHFRQCPKKAYVAMSGRQHKVLDDQAKLYDLPLSGETVDLGAVIKRFHDFLADNTHKLRKDDAAEGDGTEAGERLRNLRLKNEKLEEEIATMRKETLPRAKTHDAMANFASILRTAGEQLERRCGPEALTIFNDALDSADRVIEKTFGENRP